MKRWQLLVVLLCAVVCTATANNVNSLKIDVAMQNNGTVIVTECWDLDFDDGTEWYVVCGNLGERKLELLGVTDETGRQFVLEDAWVVNRSRAQKAGCCGIVDKGGGNYEICWGVGENGHHVFKMTYSLSDVIQGYTDYDGFNHQFVARNISPAPDKVSVVFHTEDFIPLDTTNCRIWAFGYEGEIQFFEDKYVVATANDFTSYSSIIAMLQFEKGVFNPNIVNESSFEEVKQRAFEDSEYNSEDFHLEGFWEWAGAILICFVIYLGLCVVAPPLLLLMFPLILIYKGLKKLYIKHKIKSVDWHRELPFNANLFATYHQACNHDFCNDMTIIDALTLRLIMQNALVYSESQKGFVVNDVEVEGSHERILYEMLKSASREDRVLQSDEFKDWSIRHDKEVNSWFVALTTKSQKAYEKYCKQIKETKKVSDRAAKKNALQETMGFMRFLTDFTLLNERKSVEVGLWKDYMVYATLLGVADKVKKELKQYQPIVAQELESFGAFTPMAVTEGIRHGISRGVNESKSASSYSSSSGFGGGSSFSGGGGFSGGGSGGGAR